MSSIMKIKMKKKSGYYAENYLEECYTILSEKKLKDIAEESLKDFKAASPNDEIANNWSYEIISENKKVSLFFNNSLVENGQNIAIIIDTGHGTADGRWVPGTHYLSDPIQKAYERSIKMIWEALRSYER